MMRAMAAALCLGAGVAAAAPMVTPTAAPAMVPTVTPTAAPTAAPAVAVDIGPVHAVAARVMAGVGAPDLVIRPGASPHGYSLRPSEARSLASADLVFWVGPSLTPWLADALETLAPDARRMALSAVAGATLLPVRADAAFGAHDHAHEDHAHGDHAQDDHAPEKRDHGAPAHGDDHANGGHAHDGDAEGGDRAADAGHADAGHADAGRGHGGRGHEAQPHDGHAPGERAAASIDPHLWLDPANASAWADAMAAALAAADPANAATYRANAAAARAEYAALADEIAMLLAPVAARPFLVFHDAFQYFEARFGVSAVGAVAVSEATAPGAARVAAARAVVRDSGAVCVFAEPQFEPALVETVIEGSTARAGVLDPVGTGLEPGPDFYPALLRRLGADMLACLSESG